MLNKYLLLTLFVLFCASFGSTQISQSEQVSETIPNDTFDYKVTVSLSDHENANGILKEAFTHLRLSVKPLLCNNVFFHQNDVGSYEINFKSKAVITVDQVKAAFYSYPLTFISLDKSNESLGKTINSK